jgi:hypothetical protein
MPQRALELRRDGCVLISLYVPLVHFHEMTAAELDRAGLWQ